MAALRPMMAGPSMRPFASRLIHSAPHLDPPPNLDPVLPPLASSSSSISSALPSHLPPIISRGSPTPLPTSVPSALELLKAQSSPSTGRYLMARLHSRTYLLHPRDILTLPTLKPVQPPGTTLALTRILEVGSRDYAIRSPAANGKELRKKMDWDARSLETIPPDVVKCELTVLEHTRGEVMTRFRFKRRGGNRRTIKHKPGWTRLRVGDILLGDGLSAETNTVVTEPLDGPVVSEAFAV